MDCYSTYHTCIATHGKDCIQALQLHKSVYNLAATMEDTETVQSRSCEMERRVQTLEPYKTLYRQRTPGMQIGYIQHQLMQVMSRDSNGYQYTNKHTVTSL